MRIYHNIPALNAYNQLAQTQNALAGSIKKLASGLRINGAADDAAGLAISEKMRAQIRGLDVASRNAQDGISMVQTAEGALSSTNDILQRMRELAVQAANDTLTQQDREYIQLEINQLRDEVNRISSSTQFNKKRLLDGSASVLWSSDSLDTKLFVRGGLRQVDQFGQKLVAEGNYKVSVNANPGSSQVQKSDLFKIKHKNVISDTSIKTESISDVKVDNLPAGNYTVQDVKAFRTTVANEVVSAGTWFATGTTFQAAETFAAGSTFTAGLAFANAMTFGPGAVFSAGTFATSATFAQGSRLAGGAQYAAGSVLVQGRLAGSSVIAAGSVFKGTGFITNGAIVTATTGSVVTLAKGSLLDIRDASNLLSATAGAAVRISVTTTTGTLEMSSTADTTVFALLGTYAGSGTIQGATVELLNDNNVGNGGNARFRSTTNQTENSVITFRQEVVYDDAGGTSYNISNDMTAGGGTGFITIAVDAVVGNGEAKVRTGTALVSTTVGSTATIGSGGATTAGAGAVLNQEYTSRYYALTLDAGVTLTNAKYAMQLVSAWGSAVPVTISKSNPQSAEVYQAFGLNSAMMPDGRYGFGVSINGNTTFSGTANILLEVKNVDVASNTITFKALAQVLFANGTSQSFVLDDLRIKEGDKASWTAFGLTGSVFSLNSGAINTIGYSVGDKMTIGLNAYNANDAVNVTVSATQNTAWDASWGTALQDMRFSFDESEIRGKDVHFRSFYLNSQNGQVYESDISIAFNNTYSANKTAAGDLASFKATYIGQTARLDTQLRDIDKFWDPNGKFMLDDPKTLTITQGDGKSTTVTIYANDTMGDLVSKFNYAVANGLEQGRFVDNAGSFATFVQSTTVSTSESVNGTIILRSAINGIGGTLNISGDEDIMNALSLNIIQQPKENEFYVSIEDAHSGQSMAKSVKVSGNYAVGILHPNLDFEFNPNADMKVVWNDSTKRYETRAIDGSSFETIIHIADNTSVFQIGANQGEDMSIDIGDMSMRSLGLHKVLLTNRESAARSITIIDTALNTLASQRSKLGAYQNRLEYTINNLTTAGENLTAAESRIRDLDMAKEMMNFTRLNILMQSGQSMLGQANQMPQQILQLLRG